MKISRYIYMDKLKLSNNVIVNLFFAIIVIGIVTGCSGESSTIEIPDDAPEPWPPQEAVKSFQLAPGFRIELVASEPLISDPTGVCWDEEGFLYVCEHHGYNLPGQLEIEEMNKTGVLDTVVQRVKAADKFYRQAEPETFGRVKRLVDTDGDGVMDKAELLADNLPPLYGITAARGGFILAGQKEVVFIADRDGDGKAEVRDTLYTGWEEYELERGLSTPQWGMDGWIYFGAGVGSVVITGPYLKKPVHLPSTDFRIRADGSAIEPVTGSGGTIGFAFNEDGYKFNNHSTYSIPIEWKYLERNPYATITRLTARSSEYSEVFPIAPVHPWRLTRSSGEWGDYYTNRYGEAEATASGYFTGDCCPLIYHEDSLFPSEFVGNLFVSEPAGKLVHRAIVEKEGTGLKTYRPKDEQKREFIASKDTWFSPVGLSQGPDGSIYISDFYREIIEDYSAVPRPMQQLYQLNHGMDKGRIWRVSPVTAPALNAMERVVLSDTDLEEALDNPHYWIRKTANRLIYEKEGNQSPTLLNRRTLLKDLQADTPEREFIEALRSQDEVLENDVKTARNLAKMCKEISSDRKILQLALSLGYSQDEEVFHTLIDFARNNANIRWMPEAILTGLQNRSDDMLMALLINPGSTGQKLLEPLCASISAKGDLNELTRVLDAISKSDATSLQVASLEGIARNLKPVKLGRDLRNSVDILLKGDSDSVRKIAVELALKLSISDSETLNLILEEAIKDINNTQLSTEKQLYAVSLLASSSSEESMNSLISAWTSSSLPVRTAILETIISSEEGLTRFIGAITDQVIPVEEVTTSQREQLHERANKVQLGQLESLFSKSVNPGYEEIYARFVKALNEGEPDIVNGGEIFKRLCSICHQVNNNGTAVGPDLGRAFSSSKESLLQSILWPNDKITSGFETFIVTTNEDKMFSGVLVSETGNSIVLRQAGGFEHTFQRKDIKNITNSQNSIMPGFERALTPQECADIVEWLHVTLSN